MGRLVLKRMHPGHRGWWSTGDLARLFGVSFVTIGKWLDNRELPIPFIRTPEAKRRMVRHGDLMKYLRETPEYEGLVAKAEPDPAPAAHAGR